MARTKLQITLPEELKDRIIQEAKKRDISTSLWVELLIKKQFENAKKGEVLIDLGI
jgi:hypothetical protein